MSAAARLKQIKDAFSLQAKSDKKIVVGNYFLVASVLWSESDVLRLARLAVFSGQPKPSKRQAAADLCPSSRSTRAACLGVPKSVYRRFPRDLK